MRKLRLYMIVFCLLVSLPLAFVAWRTYITLNREARSQVRFFAGQLLDEIEAELSELVRREESRAVDEYSHTLMQEGRKLISPLAGIPKETYILGYFQNNPDGTFQTPLTEDSGQVAGAYAQRVQQLESINSLFNRRKFVAQLPQIEPSEKEQKKTAAKKESSTFADRFIKAPVRSKSKTVLGQKKARVEEITADQAQNLARQEVQAYKQPWDYEAEVDEKLDTEAAPEYRAAAPASSAPAPLLEARGTVQEHPKPSAERFQAEVAPLQAVAIDEDRVFIFRRIGIQGQIYRQGFVIELQPFLDHLLTTYYTTQPISGYTRLALNAAGRSAVGQPSAGQAMLQEENWVAARTFPSPFGFLNAEMAAVSLPSSPARQTLTLALVVLGVVMVAGLVTIYKSAQAVLDLSERRSRFVSAVTHELKTPLTNIRMYIEMLDQGIAATPEREQEYFGILASESARLSGLINNVLELSRLEKQTRRFDLRQGDLRDVLDEVQAVMGESLAREGFVLTVAAGDIPACTYDREVLVQVLINLMENSIKFGRHLPEKRITLATGAGEDGITLKVTDTGPGIPKRALKRVFDDFYRVDNDLNRTTGGTGIGLALVKKFVVAMGGRVKVENNDGPGCTVSVVLPVGAGG
ncbi:HAMP domain-containing sensor histidine kinase [uncultured Desulfosarcina sp.]|uniref:sensor histidine kinase n=1 Tax=uncultured Desulfosarcina sp. TaxID=218289 RepID=UPI0029C7FF03|nr:HAMP domain-containing sensor histidine kinase [uncultured Desulfosarcina sp.]